MITILVNDTWRIELDEYSWAIAKHKPRRDKTRKQWEQVTWHRTLAQAAGSLRDRLLFESEAKGIDEVLSALSESTHLLYTAIKESGIPDSWLDAKQAAQSAVA